MNLEAEILNEHSQRQMTSIARWIGNDAARFAQLMQLFLTGTPKIVQRSSWIVSICVEKYPPLAAPWLKKMMARAAEKNVHNAVRRNVVRLLQFVSIPKSLQGRAADLCFNFLSSVDAPVAVKAFSLTVLARIAEDEPDLLNEVKLLVEQMLPYSSAGIQARGKKILLAVSSSINSKRPPAVL
jgi:hypothetical protein